jgi:tetratricopeptide (TPR) repeat protein
VVLFAFSPLLISSFNQKTNSHIISSTLSAFEPTEINLAKTIITENNKPKKIKEGRALNYIENTLIAKHTKLEKIATGIVTFGEYLRLMIFPYELSFYYGYAKIQTAHVGDLLVWVAIILHMFLLVLLFKFGYKQKAIIIGLLWYFTCIALFSNYIELVAGMVGERLGFSASAGFCVFLAAVFVSIKPQLNFKKPTSIEYILIVMVFVFGSKSIARNFEWKNPITLMQSDIKHLENSAQANHLLAINLLYTAGKDNNPQTSSIAIEKAKLHLEKSIAIYPYFFNTHYELAKVYINESNWVNAKQKLTDALALDTANLFVLEALSKVCFELNQAQEAEKYANQFISYVPQNENIHEILAYIMFTSKQYEKAQKYAKRGLIYFPNGANLLPLLKDIEQKLSEQSGLKEE